MTIYEIKQRSRSCFFSRESMKFFGQTLKSFKVRKQADGRYRISAPYGPGKPKGETVRYFNPLNNVLEVSYNEN